MQLARFLYTVVLKPRPLRALANATLRAIIPAQLERHGATIILNPTDPVVSGALTLGLYENDESSFFLGICRPGMTVLDVGANLGYYTALALRRMQNQGRVIALEPDPESFHYLEKNVKVNGGAIATCIPKAASDQNGRMTLYVSRDNRGDNRLWPYQSSTGSVDVEVVRLDHLLPELGVDHIDVLKIDVEGHEGHVLRGMHQTLARSKDIVILLEFWPEGLNEAGSPPAEVLAYLESFGLRIYEFDSKGRLVSIPADRKAFIRAHPGREYANLVATRRKLA